MKWSTLKPSKLKKQRGFITLDYLFAMTLILGLTVILFSLAITLTTVEIAQYMTFATARSYLGSHKDHESQFDYAQRKYAQLRNNGVFSGVLDNGWFTLSKEAKIIDEPAKEASQYTDHSPPDRQAFHGVQITLTSHILDFQIPFFGSTSGDSNDSDGFTTKVGSFLSREVTQKQCDYFNSQRWQHIQQIGSGSYKEAGRYSRRGYQPVSDNGC
ncbi:MAG: hypothetical protein H6626_12205 [Pseudobdellovibrionaceae bacterium]|nr:hypothetical protein [Bdellovibrionales bacterium]USN46950.1 MAG: hypothetical protein H6626_12205 [Pseudobdellovibrionaceae bacterium]